MEDADTPLHEAVRFGVLEEVREALQLGDDPNSIGFYRWSCVHESVNSDDEGVLELLLEQGGDPNVPDKCNESTPVHMAAKLGYVKCLKLLLKHGGDTTRKNRDGDSPKELATEDCTKIINGHILAVKQESTFLAIKKTTPITKASSSQDIPSSVSSLRSSLYRPSSSLSVRSISSVRSAESALTIRSSPVSGANAQRTSRKPPGANSTTFANRAPGIRLSVEYWEESSIFKIRVWSLQHVTVNPNIANSNSTLHVRSSIFPGSKIWSKTEDIPVEKYLPLSDAESGLKSKDRNFKDPVMLQSVPLDRKMTFKSIKESELKDKNVEIVMCFKTPTKIASKVYQTAKLFLKCNEAVNVVMPKWFLMTSCSIEKSKPSPAPTSSPRAGKMTSPPRVTSSPRVTSPPAPHTSQTPYFEAGAARMDPPALRSPSCVSSDSIVSVCNVKITEPLSATPPINKISSSIPNMRNPFRKTKDRFNHASAAATTSDKQYETRIEMGNLELDKIKLPSSHQLHLILEDILVMVIDV